MRTKSAYAQIKQECNTEHSMLVSKADSKFIEMIPSFKFATLIDKHDGSKYEYIGNLVELDLNVFKDK